MRQQMLPLLTPEQRTQMEARQAARGQGGPRGAGSGPHRGGRPGRTPQGPCVQPS
jgi:Spy/CpxP family protein refolding chaperone